MRSPLAMFRRHQKVLLAVFGVIIIITFTVGSYIMGSFDRATTRSQDTEVVVTWKHGKVTDAELGHLQTMHALTARFLEALIRKGGETNLPGVNIDRQTGEIVDPGIPGSNAEADVINTWVLAKKAEDLGVVISDEGILRFFDQMGGNKVDRKEYGGLLRASTDGRLIQQQLFDQMRMELAAQYVRTMASSGLYAITPGSAWEYFNRMNRRVQAEVLPLPVEDFVSKVTAKPTDAEIKKLYEDGKNRYPDPASPEPGFKSPLKIRFQYLKADYEEFLQREMAAVSDEEVAAYYEENKNDFKAPELPPIEDFPADTPESEVTETPAEPKTTEAPGEPEATEAPAEETEAPAESEEMSETNDEPAETDSETPAAEPVEEASTPQPAPEAESSDAATTPPLEAPENEVEETPASDASENEDSEATEQSSRYLPTANEAMFVAMIAAEDSEAPPAEEAPAEETPVEETPAEGTPAEPGSGDEAPAEPAPADEVPADEVPAEETPAEEAMPIEEPVAADPDEEAAPKAEAAEPTESEPEVPAAPASPETEPEAEPVKYKPLGDVADEIRRSIARPKAREKVDAAVEDARRELEKKWRERVVWQARKDVDEEVGEMPEVVLEGPGGLAEKYSLVPGETELLGAQEISDEELGKSYSFDMERRQVRTFPQIAYNEDIPLYKPAQISSFEVDVEFLYWKVEQQLPFVPELKDIRDEVVAAWKLGEARKLAEQEAEKLAEKAKADKPLADTVGEAYADEVTQTNEFTWMVRATTPSGYGPPSLGNVMGVEDAGNEFMEAVYRLELGQAGVAVNAPETIVYVARIVSKAPDEETRRENFLRSGVSYDTYFMAFGERERVVQDWYKEVEKELDVKWERPPAQPER